MKLGDLIGKSRTLQRLGIAIWFQFLDDADEVGFRSRYRNLALFSYVLQLDHRHFLAEVLRDVASVAVSGAGIVRSLSISRMISIFNLNLLTIFSLC